MMIPETTPLRHVAHPLGLLLPKHCHYHQDLLGRRKRLLDIQSYASETKVLFMLNYTR